MIPKGEFVRKSMFPTLFGKKIGRSLLSDREQLGPEAFYEKFYSDTEVEPYIVKAIYVLGESNLLLSLEGIRPNDRWVEDIHGDDGTDYMALIEFKNEIEEVFEIKISEDEFDALRTVDDLVRFLNRKVQKGEACYSDKIGERPNLTSIHVWSYLFIAIFFLIGILLVLWWN